MLMTQEQEILKAKVEFQKIEAFIRQAAIEGKRIDLFEEDLWGRMLKLGRLLMTSFVAGQGTGDLGPTIEYEGNLLKRLDKLHAKRYVSVFGQLPPIERTVYGSRETQKHEVIPLDARLGLPEGEFSYLLQQWSQSFCVKDSYQDSQAGIEQILQLRPSIRALEDMNRSMSEDVAGFRASQEIPSDEAPILVVTADCKGVRIRRDKQRVEEKSSHARKRGPRPGTKREACVGGVYTIDRFVRGADDVVDEAMRRQCAKDRPAPQNKELCAELTRPIEGVEKNGKDSIFSWFAEQIQARNVGNSKEVVCVMDGAAALWKKAAWLMKTVGITIICILDIYHVLDYLWDAARCVHGDDDEAVEAFVTERLRRILEGDVGRIVGGLRQMLTKGSFSRTQRQILNKVIGYLDRNRRMMHYDEYLAKGYPIGSGIVEGACGHVVKDRMEGTGMRWRIPSAQSMLDLRCVYLNDAWKAFQGYRVEHRVRNMYPYMNLVEQYYRAAG